MRLQVIIAGLAALAVGACIRVDVAETHFFYPNSRIEAEGITLTPGRPMPADAEILSIPFEGGAVAATRVRGRADGPLILFCGGNMFRRAIGGGETAARLTPFGDVLMFDYPGYGETPGQANLAQFRAAGQAVVERAQAIAAAEGRDLITWGHSLGGPVCTEITRETGARTLVLEATTPTARAAVNASLGLFRPVARVTLDEGLSSFDIVETLQGYSGHVIVLEAGRDETLPARLSRDMARDLEAQGVNVTRLVFPQARHNDICAQPDFQTRLAEALAG